MAMRRPGLYAPLHAYYADDPKVIEAGEDAELLFLRMIAAAARDPMSEGLVHEQIVLCRLGVSEKVAYGPDGKPSGVVPGTDAGSRAGRLVDVGLVTRESTGWRLNGWLNWNRSREEIEREHARDRNRRKPVTSVNDGSRAGVGAGSRAGHPPTLPHDFPPTEIEEEIEGNTARARKTEREERFTEFYAAYPNKKAPARARAAWCKAITRADPDVIIERVKAHAVEWAKSDPRFIPHPATWLNGDRWADAIDAPAATSGVWADKPTIDQYRYSDE